MAGDNASPERRYRPLARSLSPDEKFRRDDWADIPPWWSVNQAIAWIITRTASYVGCINSDDGEKASKIRRQIVLTSIETDCRETREAAEFLAGLRAPQDYVLGRVFGVAAELGGVVFQWKGTALTAMAGRALLGRITNGEISAYVGDSDNRRKLEVTDFVGVGQDATGADWVTMNPQPQFLSSEMIRVFPRPVSSSLQSVAKGIAPPATSPGSGAKRGPKPKYDAEAFVTAATAKLEHEGGYNVGEFDRAELARQMLQWCNDNWGCGFEPGVTWLNEHLTKAEERYELRQGRR